MSRHRYLLTALIAVLTLISCGPPSQEMTPDQIAFQKKQANHKVLEKTVFSPGGGAFEKGRPGGTWYRAVSDDPKSYSLLHAQDGETSATISGLYDPLLDYDPYKKKWLPFTAASYSVKTLPDNKGMDVSFTLRDDLYWSTLADPSKKVKVTADDVVYYYNEIDGDPALQQSGYAQQFMTLPDGTTKRITIEKTGELSFVFHFPRVVAMPELSCNMTWGPKYVLEPVKKAKGVEGLLALWSIDTDPKTIPGMADYFIESYKPGVEMTFVRNPNYWRTDAFGQKIPYIAKTVSRVIPNPDTEKLKFLSGDLDGYLVRPEDLDDLVTKTPRDYTVYAGGPALGAAFISWNQNPKYLDKKYLKWFTNVKFRQAMSCFFNRDRVIEAVYRGLADPAVYFFSKANPFFDPAISQKFSLRPPNEAKELLAEIGIKPGADGKMRDSDGNLIEYELQVNNSSNLPADIANIFSDELKKVGITLKIKSLDFQKIVSSLSRTYDWQAVMISFGVNYFPSQGSNVWPSNGNLHLWRPLQTKPATDWEARIDELYNEGNSTVDLVAAKKIWDEYQRLILDEMPVMYLVYPDSFRAYRNRWGNLHVDNLQAPEMAYLFTKD